MKPEERKNGKKKGIKQDWQSDGGWRSPCTYTHGTQISSLPRRLRPVRYMTREMKSKIPYRRNHSLILH